MARLNIKARRLKSISEIKEICKEEWGEEKIKKIKYCRLTKQRLHQQILNIIYEFVSVLYEYFFFQP